MSIVNKKEKESELRELTEIDIYNNTICKKALRIYLMGIIVSVLIMVILPSSFVASYIYNIIIVILFARMMLKIKGDEEIIKNGRLVTYAGITNITFAFALTMESRFTKVNVPIYYLVIPSTVISLLYYFLIRRQIKVFMKNSTSVNIRKRIMFMFLSGYLFSVLSLNSFWLMIIIVPIMTAYSLYEDVKLITISGIIANIIAIIASLTQVQYYDTNAYASIADIPTLIGNLMSDSLSDRTLHMFWIYMLILAFFALYTIVMVKVTKSVKKFNGDKIEIIENEKDKMQIITGKIMEIGMKIKSNAFYTQNFINELDKTTANSAEVLEDVCSENVINIDNIEEQTNMSSNITELINDVVEEVDKAQVATKKTIDGLNNSRKSFDMLKSRSNLISENNVQIIRVIDEFVDEARQVKNITNGIDYLLDETNLLSFNTYIKSAKDKEVGKGFEIIAREIYSLAKETYALTENINNIVSKLEKSAHVTHNVINDVVRELNEENNTIDKTIKEFNYMEREIYDLSDNVNEIYNRVSCVIESNEEIENHISQLRNISAEVSEATKEAEVLNEKNIIKIKDTNKIMADMIGRAEKLEEYYYMQQNLIKN